MLEHEAAAETEEDAEGHGAEKGEEKDADAVEEREDVDLFAVELRQGPVPRGGGGGSFLRQIRSDTRRGCKPRGDALEHDDGDCVVEDRFAKDDRVQLWVDVELVKDGEDRDGVGRRQGRAEQEALDDGEREAFEAEERVEVHDHAGEKGGGSKLLKRGNRETPPRTHPSATAEMKVPAKAKVRMT